MDTFDRQVAGRLATMARWCYEGEHAFKTAVKPAALRFYDRWNTQAYLVADSRYPIRALVFRGTQVSSGWSWEDIFTNSAGRLRDLRAAEGLCGRVHEGYYAALQAILPSIMHDLARPEFSADHGPLLITGHSMGGTLANIATLLIPASATVTFGQPRAGDAEFAAICSRGPYWRVVNQRDIAVMYPCVRKGYRHAGVMVRLGREPGDIIVGDRWRPSDEFPLPLGRRKRMHRVEEYEAKLGG